MKVAGNETTVFDPRDFDARFFDATLLMKCVFLFFWDSIMGELHHMMFSRWHKF
jgi:hypothetical protein